MTSASRALLALTLLACWLALSSGQAGVIGGPAANATTAQTNATSTRTNATNATASQPTIASAAQAQGLNQLVFAITSVGGPLYAAATNASTAVTVFAPTDEVNATPGCLGPGN